MHTNFFTQPMQVKELLDLHPKFPNLQVCMILWINVEMALSVEKE